MLPSILTENAQTTIPRAVRTALNLQDGDRLRYAIEGHTVSLTKLSRPVFSHEHAAIPEEVRVSLGLEEGDQIMYTLEGGQGRRYQGPVHELFVLWQGNRTPGKAAGGSAATTKVGSCRPEGVYL
jgi:antitoxin PrlF